jgi:hypothetical protein
MKLWTDKKEEDMKDSIKYLQLIFENLIKKRKQLFEVENLSEKSDLFDVLLRSKDPQTGKPFTNKMVEIFLFPDN